MSHALKMTEESGHLLDQIIHSSPVAMMCTMEGSLIHSRPMYTLPESNAQDLLFLTTSPNIVENSLLTICYSKHEDFQYVCVHGSVHLTRDRTYLQKLWKQDYEKWVSFNDPNLSLLSVTPIEIEFWDHFRNQKLSLNDESLDQARRSYEQRLRPQGGPKIVDPVGPDEGSGYSWSRQSTPEQAAKVSSETGKKLVDKNEKQHEADSDEVSEAILSDEISQG